MSEEPSEQKKPKPPKGESANFQLEAIAGLAQKFMGLEKTVAEMQKEYGDSIKRIESAVLGITEAVQKAQAGSAGNPGGVPPWAVPILQGMMGGGKGELSDLKDKLFMDFIRQAVDPEAQTKRLDAALGLVQRGMAIAKGGKAEELLQAKDTFRNVVT